MTDYIGFQLTQAGEDIMARVIGGLEITFKRIAIGDGYDYDVDNFKNRTALVNEVLSLTTMTMQVTSANEVKISAKFSSSDMEESFYNREVGLYIVDPDDEDEEILYAYGNVNDAAEYITPDVSNYGVLKEYDLYVAVGSSANVHIYISGQTVTTEIEFEDNDWTYDSNSQLYTLQLGSVNEVLKVYKVASNIRYPVPLVDSNVNNHVTTLRSLTAFDGVAIAI